MAVHHITVTLAATATPISATSINARWVYIESETGNADVKVGGSTITTTDYGMIVTAGPATAKVMAPADGNLCIGLNTTYLLGTASQKVHVLYIL